MTAFSFGDVILVPFPFTDQSQAKQRPAVVVSSARYNTERPDLILMAITSQVRSPATFGEVIVQHWQAAKAKSFRVCGGSSSSVRPSTSCASSFASAISVIWASM
jgi:hypothetical protein